jgi:hypothetical protein
MAEQEATLLHLGLQQLVWVSMDTLLAVVVEVLEMELEPQVLFKVSVVLAVEELLIMQAQVRVAVE